MEHAMKTGDKASLPFLLFLLLWPVLLLALLFAGARVWEAAQKPIVRHCVMEALEDRTAQAKHDLASADRAVRTRDKNSPDSGDSVWYRTADFGFVPSSREYGYC